MAAQIGPLPTQVDIELESVPRGDELRTAIAPNRAARSVMAVPATYPAQPLELTSDPELVVTWGDLQQRHPEWMGDFWQECRALYAGGPRLLADMRVLRRVFPMNMHEDARVYAQRCARAHYYPYPGTILDHLIAGLSTDALSISFTEVDDQGKITPAPPAAEWWQKWVTDVTDEAERPADYGLTTDEDDDDDDEGGCTMHEFLVEALREALQTRTAWVQADLPPYDAEAAAEIAIDSQLAAEKAAAEQGLDDPYLCIVPAEQVIDWKCDDRDRLLWVLVLNIEQPRPTLRDRRGKLLHTYTLWTPELWARYEVLFDPQSPPVENKAIAPVEARAHDFGRVPFERLRLSEGLYAMGKLHSLAREHFNKRCAMGWAEFKALFSVLYEFLGPEDTEGLPVAEAQTDASRATNQIRGQGYTQVRGKDDDARYVGPDPAVFTAARDSCNDAMREMHRVMFSMALSANMDSKALNRTAESKDKDEAVTTVLLNEFGKRLRKFCRRLFVLASLGRREPVPHAEITGLQDFDVESTTAVINEAVAMYGGQLPIKSSLFSELYLDRTYATILGDMTPEQRETMREQIRESISQEELMAEAMAMSAMQQQGDGGDDGGDRGDDVPDVQQPPKPTAKPTPAASGKTVTRMGAGRTGRAKR